jgi:hypothetical protein
MATIAEVETGTGFTGDRASCPGGTPTGIASIGLHDEDEGIAEALRRDAEFEANPSLGMTLEELDQRIENRRS